MGPGPPRETCGPDELPLTWTLIGQPGTGILLKETLIMCSQASTGTKDTANLQNILFRLPSRVMKKLYSLCIAFGVNLGGNVVALGGDGDFEITLASITGVDCELNWSTNRPLGHRSDGNFSRIVRLGDEWCSLERD